MPQNSLGISQVFSIQSLAQGLEFSSGGGGRLTKLTTLLTDSSTQLQSNITQSLWDLESGTRSQDSAVVEDTFWNLLFF